jgi:hypothetical protein
VTGTQQQGHQFWLEYVQAAGGLVERGSEGTLAVLPSALQAAFDLPEEVTVTTDPDVAREEQALLISAGHPLLSQAAEQVLTTGDTGSYALPARRAAPPGRDTLLAQAREQFPIDHGKIDATDTPHAAGRTVLRLGTLIDYTLSTEDSFTERAETWIDVASGLELPDPVTTRLAGLPAQPLEACPAARDLTPLITQAHRIVDQRAHTRRDTLTGRVRSTHQRERDRTQDYYTDQLASLEHRQQAAPPEKAESFAARAAATRTERDRRLAEIDEKYQPRHEITPYRLHWIHLPAQRLPIEIRRGTRTYPAQLDWLTPAGMFTDLACPSCGAHARLVAGKTTLGCTSCLPNQSLTPPTPRYTP